MDSAKHRNCAIIADDHGLYRSGMAAVLLDEFGFRDVVGVSTFDEAMAELSGSRLFDLALFDLSMPGMSGPASLAQLRETHANLKIAIISASEDRSQVLDGLAAGLNGFIPKSLPNDDIVAAIESILGGSIFVPRLIVDVAMPSAKSGLPALGPSRAAGQPQGSHIPAHITPRQRNVLEYIRKGFTNKEIARQLDITEGTVKIHVACLLTTFSVRNRTELAVRE